MDALRIILVMCFCLASLASTSDLEGLVQSEKEPMFEDESEELTDRMDRDLESVAGDKPRGFIAALAGFPEAIEELINGKKSSVSKPKNGSRIIPIVGRIIKSLAARSQAKAAQKMDKKTKAETEVETKEETKVETKETESISNEATVNAKREALPNFNGPKAKGMPIPAGYILWHPVSANFEGIQGDFREELSSFSPNQRMHNGDHPHRPFFIPLRQPSFQNNMMAQSSPSLFALPPVSAVQNDQKMRLGETTKDKKASKQNNKNQDKPRFNLPNVPPNHFPNSPFFDPLMNQVNQPFPPPNHPPPPPPPQFRPQNQQFPPQRFNFNNPLPQPPQPGPHFSESQQFFQHQPHPEFFHPLNRFGPPHPDQFPQPSINVPFQFQLPPVRPKPNPGAHPAKFQIEQEKQMRAQFGPFFPPPPPPHFNPNMLPPHLPPPPLPHQFPPFIPMDHPPANLMGPNKPFNAKDNDRFNPRPNVQIEKQKFGSGNANGPKNSNSEAERLNVEADNSNFRPGKASFEQEKAHFDSKKPSFEHKKPNFNLENPNFEQKKPNHGFENANFENEKPHFEHAKPNFDQGRPNFDQRRPNFDQGRPNFEQEKPNFERERPNFDQEKPNFDQEKPNFGQEKPNFGQERANFGQEKPNFGQERPNFDQGKPNFGQERPNLKNENRNFGQERPNFDQGKPNFRQERPNLKNENRNFENGRSNFETKKPNSGSTNPNFHSGRTNFNTVNPSIDSGRPNFGPNNLNLESGRQNFGPGNQNPASSRPIHASFETGTSRYESGFPKFSSTTPKSLFSTSSMMTPVVARDFDRLPPTAHPPLSKQTTHHHKESFDSNPNSFEYVPFGLPPSKSPPALHETPLNTYPHHPPPSNEGAKKPESIFEHFQIQEPKVRSGNQNPKVKNYSTGSTHPPPLVHHPLPPPHYAADTFLDHQMSAEVSEYAAATTHRTMTSTKSPPKNWSKSSHVQPSTPSTVYQYEVKYSSPLTLKPSA